MSDIIDNLNKINAFPVCGENEKKGLKPSSESSCTLLDFPGSSYLSSFLIYRNIKMGRELEKYDLARAYRLTQQFAEPLYFGFAETTDNIEFLRIANDFFRSAFWNGSVWVGYFSYKELADIREKPDEANQLLKFDETDTKYFHLFYCSNGEYPDYEEPNFMHLQTGLFFTFYDYQSTLVEFKWSTERGVSVFKDWFLFALMVLRQEQDFEKMHALELKKILYHATSSDDDLNPNRLEEIEQRFLSRSPLISVREGQHIESISFTTSQDCERGVLERYRIRDRWLSELGIVANTNPKMERLTTGENYKDIVNVANRQRAVLNNLKVFAADVLTKFDIELSFAVNGIPQRLPIEGDPENPELAEKESANMPEMPVGNV